MHGNSMFAPLSLEEIRFPDRRIAQPREKLPIVPVPADAPLLETYRHPKHGAPSKVWRYADALDQLMFAVARFDFLDGDGKPAKEILPLTFCDIGRGRRAWRAKGITGPRPLYRLPDITARAEAVLIVAEGEKSADAAAILFPDMVATTPPHGAKSPHKADWAPVAGRTVIIATDNDEAGQQFGDKVSELARAAGAKAILHLPPDRLGQWVWKDGERRDREGDLPKGWDIADALDEGWTVEAVAAMMADPAFLSPYSDAEEREALRRVEAGEPEEATRWPFRVTQTGVEKRIERADRETGIITIEWRWFCSPLQIAAETRSSEGEEWGRLLKITDRDARAKEWAMPMSMLAGDGTAYRERLLSLGLIMAPGKFARDALHEYISTARPGIKARCVARVGWHSRTFTFSNQTVEPSNG
ncbi:conserved hypothetical protein [Hyphomicrobiales bacterium]|nr:conserved hypothetical protein [Hyphomicrobiales bacterium]CAH1673416.1 conserved hypothetical protein [Hyphomicrobiales bacterium]